MKSHQVIRAVRGPGMVWNFVAVCGRCGERVELEIAERDIAARKRSLTDYIGDHLVQADLKAALDQHCGPKLLGEGNG